MTNDKTTLNGALAELGEVMADNLVTMGVSSADPSDGLTTLAGKILNVPGGGSLDLDTSITLTSDETVIDEGESVTLTSVLSASYDDSSQANVDMNGVLIGATVLFKEGSTTLGTGTTNANGVATATISNLSGGTHTIKAVFAGTSVFDDCESTAITIEVMSIPHIEIVFNGTTLTQYSSATDPLVGTDVTIDYGDGTIATGNNFGHTYATSGDHTIKIYGVTALGDYCFTAVQGITSITLPETITSIGQFCFYACYYLTNIVIPDGVTSIGQNCFNNCTGLTSATIPDTVTSIGFACFTNCSSLAHIYLNWDSANDIVTYQSSWIANTYANLMFDIPAGTKSLYIAKSYPSSKLDDGSVPDSITLTADKSILSYADGESATLSATVLDDNSQPLEGETVEFFKGSTSLGTSTTNSSGVATKSYSSTGAGDISFTAEVGSLVSGSYTIIDANWYNPLTSNHNNITLPSTYTITHSSDGMNLKNTNWDSGFCDMEITSPTSIKYEITSASTTTAYIGLWTVKNTSSDANRKFHSMISNGKYRTYVSSWTDLANNPIGTYELKIYSDKIEVYKDNSLLQTVNYTLNSLYLSLASGNGTSNTFTIKDIIFKSL